MILYVVRHGETVGNAERFFQHPHTPLTERGERQARLVAERLTGAGIGAILTSDYARALATARAIESTTGATLETEPLLRERSFGDLRGMRIDDFAGNPYADDFAPPNGETWAEFDARIGRAWAAVRAWAEPRETNVAVVCHGLVCRSLAGSHIGLPDDLPMPARWPNTAVTVVERTPDWRITRLACGAHLEAEDLDPRAPLAGA